MIRELIGKDRNKDEEAFVYDEDGIKNEILVVKEDFSKTAGKKIYTRKQRKQTFLSGMAKKV